MIKRFSTLYIDESFWIVARGYKLYKYMPQTGKLEYFSRLEDKKNSFLSYFKLPRRLFRAEIRGLYHFRSDTWMCIARKAIFKYNTDTGLFEKCHNISRGTRPMNLCQDKDGIIYYGEYFYNPMKKEVHIMASADNGKHWNIVYKFNDGAINHIHGIFRDPFTDNLWVATGDESAACIFGYTNDGFRTFNRKFYGSQQYRICVPLFTKEEIIYATDSQYEKNFIKSIDRASGEVKNLQEIQGSGIYSAQNGKHMMVSTTIEPSSVNLDNYSHLWYSPDGHHWKELCSFKKDIWKMTYFQFGSIRFPEYAATSPYLVFTGRAVKCLDGKTMIIPINEL